ncbi:hypothetical protein [Maridesulfovibrio bastinii]|uniref:hypothetical protein n=1 Tax=Maridesulfovibrio bastinii TaxID=47157 RepID=UPI00041E98D1|nr:hypothetical protein [Maridesulfovibrio bastinii]
MAGRVKNVTDIRLDVEFFEDFRFQKIMRRFGTEGVLGVILLWCYCAKHFPSDSGHFPRYFDEEDLLFACKVDLDRHDYVEMLLQLEMIGKEDGHFYICEWDEMQPWAAEARERSEKAKKAAAARWKKEKKQPVKEMKKSSEIEEKKDDASALHEHKSGKAKKMQNGDFSNAPSPSPTLYVNTPYSPPEGDELVEVFCEVLPELPKPKAVTEKLMGKVRKCRCEGGPNEKGILWWRWYFEQVRDFPFLLGEVNPEWKASLPWLINPEKMSRVLGGEYQSREEMEVNGLTSGQAGSQGMSEEEYARKLAVGEG